MNKYIGNLVKRKIGGVVGVLISTTPIDEDHSKFLCGVAFGFLSKLDAEANKSSTTEWTEVHSDHIELLSQIS